MKVITSTSIPTSCVSLAIGAISPTTVRAAAVGTTGRRLSTISFASTIASS